MLHDYLQVYTLSIVFLGDFNPVIPQPFWLANKKLIREQEAQDAKIEVIHNEISKFKLGEWLSVEITRDRLELKTSLDPYFEPMKDLGISIFKALNETPIKAVGINHLKYFVLSSEEDYYNFGNKLAPLHNWNEIMSAPKLLNLEIIEQNRKDKLNGHYRIKIQPSDIKLSSPYAVLININDHYSLEKDSDGRNGEIINILGENWTLSAKRAEADIEKIWQKVTSSSK